MADIGEETPEEKEFLDNLERKLLEEKVNKIFEDSSIQKHNSNGLKIETCKVCGIQTNTCLSLACWEVSCPHKLDIQC